MSNEELYFDGSTEIFWRLCSLETCRNVEECHCNVKIFPSCDTRPLYMRNFGDNFRSIILNIICLFK